MNVSWILIIGIIILILGIIYILSIHVTNNIKNERVELDGLETATLQIKALHNIGFYKIRIDDFKGGGEIFVQIRNLKQNIIHDKKINTYVSVNYFETIKDREYELILTNFISDKINLEIEYGDLDHNLSNAGIIVLFGIVTVILGVYYRLKQFEKI